MGKGKDARAEMMRRLDRLDTALDDIKRSLEKSRVHCSETVVGTYHRVTALEDKAEVLEGSIKTLEQRKGDLSSLAILENKVDRLLEDSAKTRYYMWFIAGVAFVGTFMGWPERIRALLS